MQWVDRVVNCRPKASDPRVQRPRQPAGECVNEPHTPYWWAFLKHPYNKLALLGLLTTAVLLSLPWGGDGFGIGMLALAAIQMVGLATVPGLPTFQARVDAQDRQRARQSRRDA